jgi:hypothetical protein
MLDICRKLEWISDIVYRKLCHILDMRNQIGASHPNSYDINSYELLGWLKTCLSEVINDKPSASAIQVRNIIENIKTQSTELDQITLKSFNSAIKDLSSVMASNLLSALFGIYLADNTSKIVRNNILALAKQLWPYCRTETKYDLGEKKEFYKNNLDIAKDKLAYTFFEKCDGLHFLSITERSLQLSSLCDSLSSAHNNWDNYYNEPPIAKAIMQYIKTDSDIPAERTEKLINTFLECRIGREVAYCNGVSQGALPSYTAFFKLLSQEQIKILLSLFRNHMSSIYNGNGIRADNALQILLQVKSPIIGARLNEIIDYMIEFAHNGILNKVYTDKTFKDLCNGIIDLK